MYMARLWAAASLFAGVAFGASATAAATLTASSSLPTISAVGSKFYDSNGDQFYVKGVAYQLTDDDPLLDTDQCTRDASLMAKLGANAIRVYHVDPDSDHTGCMAAFANHGIYLFLDLDTFTTSISPTSGRLWTSSQYEAFGKVMDAFASYTNTLGFFVGNEVIALANQSDAAPYIKAATRDMKAYRKSQGYRDILIGYSAADIAELRPMLQNYLACGGNSSEAIDFFSLNAYEWCGDSSYTVSGYSSLNTQAQGYNIPIFFSETGCNTVQPRTFDDQAAILGSEMDSTWSGAIVYEWIEETNNYGLVSYGASLAATATGSGYEGGILRTGTPTPVSPDYYNLQSQWSTLTPTGTPSSEYTVSVTTPTCPTSTASGWLVDGNPALPTLNQALVSSSTSTAAATGSKTDVATTATGTATGAAASASSTSKSGSSGSRELAGMGAGLVSVMLGFIYWL